MPRTLCTTDFYASRFRSFERTAFRLEARREYAVESEAADFAAYRSGQPLPPPRTGELAEWDALVAKNVCDGKTMRRVHFITPPLTPYLRFEIEWGYIFTASAGEHIRLLITEHDPLGLEAVGDFWLFDNRELFFVKYDTDGRYLGVELETGFEEIRRAASLQDVVWDRAISLQHYLAHVRNG